MNSIDYEALSNAVQEVIDENLLSKYDFEAILRTAKVVWEEVLCNTDDNDQYKKRDILEENNDYKVSGYTTFNIVKSLYNCSIANNEIYIQQLIN